MNKSSLLTIGRKLRGNEQYLISVTDLEPAGGQHQSYFVSLSPNKFSYLCYFCNPRVLVQSIYVISYTILFCFNLCLKYFVNASSLHL